MKLGFQRVVNAESRAEGTESELAQGTIDFGLVDALPVDAKRQLVSSTARFEVERLAVGDRRLPEKLEVDAEERTLDEHRVVAPVGTKVAIPDEERSGAPRETFDVETSFDRGVASAKGRRREDDSSSTTRLDATILLFPGIALEKYGLSAALEDERLFCCVGR